jgi:predicted nucleic acid-binding protein
MLLHKVKKMQVYLDTNILYSYLKKKIEEKISGNDGKEIKFILFDNVQIIPVSSFFTLIELVNVLKREMNLSRKSIEDFVKDEIEDMRIKLIEKTKIDENVLKWCLNGLDFKDAIHLSIVKENNLTLLTNDLKLTQFARSVGTNSITNRELKSKIV